jgi:hypothetical protein
VTAERRFQDQIEWQIEWQRMPVGAYIELVNAGHRCRSSQATQTSGTPQAFRRLRHGTDHLIASTPVTLASADRTAGSDPYPDSRAGGSTPATACSSSAACFSGDDVQEEDYEEDGHRQAIDAAFEHRLSVTLAESVNTITRLAFGFRDPAALIGLAVLSLSGYRPPLSGR